jgi:hypothetical protein
LYLGLGGRVGSKVIPVAVFAAQPSQTYTIVPVVKFYICTGEYLPGEIIDIQSVGVKQPVEFTQGSNHSHTFIHQSDGTYKQVDEPTARAYKYTRLEAEKVALLGQPIPPTVVPSIPTTDLAAASQNASYSASGSQDDEEALTPQMKRVLAKMLTMV